MSAVAKKPFKAKKGQFTVSRQTMAAFNHLVRSQEIIEWFSTLLGERIDKESKDLQAILMDGIYLCQVMNKLQPGSVKKIATKRTPFNMRDNINCFLTAIREYGLNDTQTFQCNELFENQNMQHVIASIQALDLVAKKKGFAGPFIAPIPEEEQPSFSKADLAETAKKLNLVKASIKPELITEDEVEKKPAAPKAEPKVEEAKPEPAAEVKPQAPVKVEEPKVAPKVEEAKPEPVVEKPKEVPAAEPSKPAPVEEAKPAEAPKHKEKKKVSIAEEVEVIKRIDEYADDEEVPMLTEKPLTETEVEAVMDELKVDEADAEYVMVESGEGSYVVMAVWELERREMQFKLKGMKKHR